jgi:TM2 domain-containing membrane protein YozV
MRNRTIAALLAFFLGYLGIHKFYLGENLAGILYLLFFWTFIPGIIAFFEFRLFVTWYDSIGGINRLNPYLARNLID